MQNYVCPFCNYDKSKWTENVFETKNFQIRVGIGILTAGHCMITTKDHIACMGALSDELEKEYLNLKDKLIEILTKNAFPPFMIEYGVFCQSVFHAHTHFFPSSSMEGEFKNINIIEQMAIPAINKFSIPYSFSDFKTLKDVYNKYGQYMSFEQDGKLLILETQNLKKEDIQEDLLWRRFFINKIGTDTVKSWKIMTEKQKEMEEKRIEKTKLILNFGDL